MSTCIRNGDGVLAVTDEDKKIAWKIYHEKFLNTELAWDGKSLYQVDTVSPVPHLIDKDMVGSSLNKVKNGKAPEPSVVVSEMVQVPGEVGV